MGLTLWHWLAAGAVLITLEMMVGTSLFLLWIGLWAIFFSGVAYLYPALSWEVQLSLFALASLLTSLIVWTRIKDKKPLKSEQVLNKRGMRYLHQEFTLGEPIKNGRGTLSVDDGLWRIEGPDLPGGTKVVVIKIKGATLVVRPFDL